jgi:uroporphyrin-III C-methyltransferase/precorrin-2 dehydrogenase/sirohydrochlorin ferrochelatase
VARRVQFVTGHGADGKLPSDLNWSAIADPDATTIIYMPVKTLKDFTKMSLAYGLDPATPALAVASATRPDQAVLGLTFASLLDRIGELPAGAPVTIILGKVARDPAASAHLLREAA